MDVGCYCFWWWDANMFTMLVNAKKCQGDDIDGGYLASGMTLFINPLVKILLENSLNSI